MAYYLKFRNYVLLLFVFEFYRFSESRSMGTFDSVQLGDILRQTDLTSMAGNVNGRGDDVEWPNYTDNGDLKIDLSLNQLVNLMRKLKSQNKIDRQDRIKKQICYVQELC